MKKNSITIITIILVLAIASGIIFLNQTGFAAKNTSSEKIAKWIGQHSLLYIQKGCPHCENQEKMFGDNVKYLTIIDCLGDTQACILKGIEGTPTWVIDGQKYVGVQSIDKLKELTGYPD